MRPTHTDTRPRADRFLTGQSQAAVLRLGAIAASVLIVPDALAGPCTSTATAALRACRAEVVDDFQIARGICINLSDAAARSDCLDEARIERQEARVLCREQRDARLDLCEVLGEDRYDPDFDPADFVDPLAIGGAVAPNPYFPLIPGTRWVYEGGDETVTVTVTVKTKLIEGVTCVVVNDLVEEDGVPIENTDDWYAQDALGNVWYCGEIAKNFEIFEGDDPEEAELVDIDGSWKAGRDGAQPGIIMLALPQAGDVYRQEVALGEAEDAARVISTTGSAAVPAASCDGDCVITRDFTPLEPDANERKFYAPGVGLILERDLEFRRPRRARRVHPAMKRASRALSDRTELIWDSQRAVVVIQTGCWIEEASHE